MYLDIEWKTLDPDIDNSATDEQFIHVLKQYDMNPIIDYANK